MEVRAKMGITRQEVIDNELMSEDIIEYIPETCPICGSDIEFTDSLKQIYCTNKRCSLKIAARLESMAKAMKADGWGESTCLAVVEYFKLVSPYQVFVIGEKGLSCPDVSAFSKKIASICDPEKRKVKLWEVVRLAGIPSIETIAYKIFDGYSSLEEAYEKIETLQVPFIAEKLGLRNADTGVMAVNVYKTLIEYKDELLFGESKFDVYIPTGMPLSIAITGGVAGYHNKGEFIQYINNRYSGKVNAMLMNSVTSQVDYLVADNDTSSNKYRTAMRLKDKGSKIEILSSQELIRELDIKMQQSEPDGFED